MNDANESESENMFILYDRMSAAVESLHAFKDQLAMAQAERLITRQKEVIQSADELDDYVMNLARWDKESRDRELRIAYLEQMIQQEEGNIKRMLALAFGDTNYYPQVIVFDGLALVIYVDRSRVVRLETHVKAQPPNDY